MRPSCTAAAWRSRRREAPLMEPWWISLIKAFVVVNLVMVAFAYTTWLERKLLGRMQLRYGPNRAGPFGLLQPFADLIKLVRKEAFQPDNVVNPLLYIVAPVISMFTALAAFSVIPFGAGWKIWHYHVTGEVVNVPIALILVFALGSIGIYGFIVGGWGSESKYSLLGAMRTCAPFDLPEADTELVAGYHTEYSGMRWGLFQTAEYINMITLSALTVTLFFAGYHGFYAPLGPLWFFLKLFACVSVFIWMKATLPRLRYDQLMRFGWKVLLPVATLNALVTAIVVV